MNLLDFFFPKICCGCGKFGSYICSHCRTTIQLHEPSQGKCPMCGKPAMDGVTHLLCRKRFGMDGLISFFRYEGVIKKAVKKIKYRFASDIVSALVDHIPDWYYPAIKKILMLHDEREQLILVPVPLHRQRKHFRGFNQSYYIARALGKKWNMPVVDILVKKKKTLPQADMKDKSERLKNLRDAFMVKPEYIDLSLSRSTVILVDDVFTTGATLRSAAEALKKKGMKRVWGVTLAR